MKQLKFACICLTFDRPELLSHALYSYLKQDYPDDCSELLILDDTGQYKSQSCSDGKFWELVSVSRRFSSIGAKRNAAISMVSNDVDAIVIWDDDDIYLPWTLKAHEAALVNADWSRPSVVVDYKTNDVVLTKPDDQYVFHASWAFRMDIFKSSGGYGDIISGEDKDLAHKFDVGKVKSADPICLGFNPYFIFNRSGTSFHVSYMKHEQYHKLKPRNIFIDKLKPNKWPVDYIGITQKLCQLDDIDQLAISCQLMELF